MEKLTINELKGYLGTGLKGVEAVGMPIHILHELGINDKAVWKNQQFPTMISRIDCKPLLYPLSSLTEYRDDLGFVPIEKLLRKVDKFYPIECYEQDVKWILESGYEALIHLPFGKVQKLYEWHIDLHKLIDRNLAINIKTLENGK